MSTTRKSPHWAVWLGMALAISLIALGIYLIVPGGDDRSPEAASGDGNVVQAPPDSDVPENPSDPAEEKAMEQAQSKGTQANIQLEEPPTKAEVESMDIKKLDGDLVAESVGLSVSLSEMSEVDNTINPPGLDSAYVVRGHGSPGSRDQGTTYIALHSVQGATIPGNKLIDVPGAKAALKQGDSIKVKGSKYSVTKSFTVDKDKLPGTSEVWEEKDGKLVILTCLQRSQGRSVQNVVIEAQLS